MLFWLSVIVLFVCSVFGGGTHAGYAGDFIAQLLSVPLLITALWPALSGHDPDRHKARIAMVLLGIIAFVTALELLPLPFSPGGAFPLSSTQGQETGLPSPSWAPLSRTPQATWAAAVSLFVPLAVFAAVTRLGLKQRLILCWLLLGIGGLSLFLGFAQVAQGPQSELRFYGITNPQDAVGLFANRNHFAAHLYVTLTLAAMWFQMTAASGLERRTLGTKSSLLFVAAAVFLVAIVGGLAFSRSRAGMILAAGALAGIAAIVLTQARPHGNTRQRASRGATIAVLGFAAIFTVLFGLGRLATRFEPGQGPDARSVLSRTTFETALKALPLGTGLGSFVPVYATVEKTEDIAEGYANRAHNDLAEILLETGLPGALILAAFLIWFVWRTRTVWLNRQHQADPEQTMLEKSATLIVALLLLHSLADYPLRTGALGAMFAFFCAIIASPASASLSQAPHRRQHDTRILNLQTAAVAAPREKWEGPVQWPESWQLPKK
jgi:O-antigen ligase